MNTVRSPAVAGSFYPGDQRQLMQTVDSLLSAEETDQPCPKVIIAPHAGYVYSGPVAASAYRRLANRNQEISRVVLLGPSHKVAFKGIAASSANSFLTPLGEIPLAVEAIKILAALHDVVMLDEAHAREHSLEVQLPFLQRALGAFELIPLVVGDAGKEEVARVLEKLWGGDETLIIISTDLSHYHDYSEAQHLDASTSAKILGLQANLTGKEACGCRPLNGLLSIAAREGMSIEQIAVNNSGDTAGPRNRVVGYGAYVINNGKLVNKQGDYSLAQRQSMLQMARDTMLQRLLGNNEIKINLKLFPANLLENKASFVTLNKRGVLRGCIGSLNARRPLILDVINNAQAAAFHDPRFKPLSLQEFQEVDVHISILTEAQPMDVNSRAELLAQLQPGIDGLIIKEKGKSATYLPSVWGKIAEPQMFVNELRRKAGLDPQGWDETTEVFRYQTIEFS